MLGPPGMGGFGYEGGWGYDYGFGYGPAAWGAGGHWTGPYGAAPIGFSAGGKKGFKGKGKGKKYNAAPKVEKPAINASHINASKDPMDGGINFKTILQEQVSKQIHRPIAPGDLLYTADRVRNGRIGCVELPCLGLHPEDSSPYKYEADMPASDEKKAGHGAAAKALADLYPDIYLAALEAHEAGGVPSSTVLGASQQAVQDLDGSVVTPPPSDTLINGDPKSTLNTQLQTVIGRPVQSGDIVYETQWSPMIRGYMCFLKLIAVDGGAKVYQTEHPNCNDKKLVEKSAANLCIEENAAEWAPLLAAKEKKKADEAAHKARSGGKGKGKGKSKPSFGGGYRDSFSGYGGGGRPGGSGMPMPSGY